MPIRLGGHPYRAKRRGVSVPQPRWHASSLASPACLKVKDETRGNPDEDDLLQLEGHLHSRAACSGSQSETPFCGRLGQGQENSMTLTILDPRSGETVTIYVENVPAVRQPLTAKVVTHPLFRKPH
jgi:hypothetical protein